MAGNKGTAVFRNLVADYLDVGTSEAPDIRVMSVFETIDESPNAQTTEKHYTGDKSATVITTGYQTQFPITADLYKDNRVVEYIRDIGEEQQLGTVTDYYRVRLYQPIAGKENTYYARKFRVGFEISGMTGAGGEIISIEGNMNAQGDAVIGEFNTTTQTFTSADDGVLGELTVTSAAGSTTGNTKITVTPAKSSGNSYKYKTAASVTLPEYDVVCSTGYTDWDGTADITATTGQKILIVEVDGANKAKKAGIATVTSKA